MLQLVMLGTGHAMVTKCYNTCFTIENDNESIMIDAGGGNGILTQVEKAGLDWSKIRALFVTHAHTDHILGAIWVLRKVNTLIKQNKYTEFFKVYGLAENLNYLKYNCVFLLNDSLSDHIQFIPTFGEDKFTECGMEFEIININSTKQTQLGFRAVIRNYDKPLTLVCLGDEPCHQTCEEYVKDADWLLSEAFCLRNDKEIFHPYEKNHSTAYDAGLMAEKLGVKNLVLYHTEDSDLENRARKYTQEAMQNFKGNVFVPDDLQVIRIL
ncbi:MAG: MBL fold metallo-hydrolase [Lachnospiraceae bacterium]|nr:MBL fold metallo-hydrolase [Lachnospiraceae bacterium]